MIDDDKVPHLPKVGYALNTYFIETYWAYENAIFFPHNEFIVIDYLFFKYYLAGIVLIIVSLTFVLRHGGMYKIPATPQFSLNFNLCLFMYEL